jgi:hypothetical protein
MKKFILLLALLSCQSMKIPQGYEQVFNGKDLQGWHQSLTTHQGISEGFQVEKGAIVLKQSPYGQGGILLTDEAYQDFELLFSYKGTPGTNGGVFFRSAESGTAYQLEMVGDGDPGTGALFGEMLRVTTRVPAPDLSTVWKLGEWNEFKLRVVGEIPHVTLWINGKELWDVHLERNDLLADSTSGMIALQLHWNATLLPIPGGSCCAYSWRPHASHQYKNLFIKRI